MLANLSPGWLIALGMALCLAALFILRKIYLFLAELFTPFKKGKSYWCRVIAVSDGDTLTCSRLNIRRSQTKLRFAYVDANGDRSDRRVVVHQLEGTCFQGLCLSRRATRTFRLDRVQGDITSESSGEVQEPWAWARSLAKTKSNPSKLAPQATHEPKQMGEVLFTGFSRTERDALEQLADAHHWCVRKSITKNLTVLVAGPRAGEAKLSQARAAGVQVMDRWAFELLCK